MARRLIVGDIHAQFELLEEVLAKACFNPEEDILYSVGDLCDRGRKAVSTLRYLMSLKNFRPVLGNHDLYLEYYLFTGSAEYAWLKKENGKGTKASVDLWFRGDERLRLKSWLASIPVIRMEKDFIIMHGGIPFSMSESKLIKIAMPRRPFPLLYSSDDIDSTLEKFCSDRNYIKSAMREAGFATDMRIDDFVPPLKTRRTIFVGHTPTPDGKPFVFEKYHIVAIDTGAGSGEGPLTVMDMDSLEYWQAGPV